MTFPPRSFVLAYLLLSPIYREDREQWETLRAERDAISHYFREIGQELVIDESEGYAFLRQIEIEGVDRVPRIGRRQPLGYTATLLLVCLREELARFDAAPNDSSRLVLTREQLRELVGQFVRETNNQIRDQRTIDAAINRVVDLGFLRTFGAAESDSFEVMRILKARFGPAELEQVRDRLKRHAEERA
ncbi:MAG TPA: DUF4194 domain-containing protein [Candidatus Angelobacter sp.]|nr:DUF4194 domain-containing protein [Candidatus Angelobacter sp.]